jgi:hypothetical protein
MLLGLGEFDKGWDLYDWRWKLKDFAGKMEFTKKPIWNKEKNATLLIWPEQGIGDEVMFSSIFNEVREEVKYLIIKTDPRLIPIFERSFPEIKFISNKEYIDENLYTHHLPMGTLPKFYRRSRVSFEGKNSSYLKTNTQINNDLNKYNRISTPMGGKFKVILPDGSLVVLNAASTLKYPVHFDEKLRKVSFTGEAYFEIAKLEDKHKKRVPFYVYSNDQIVEVLGTHFNINSYDNEEYSKTTLLEGSVKIINEKSAATAKILKPGQQAVIKRGDIQTKIMIADEAQALAWKDGYFLFKNTNIKDVVNELERWYNVDIQYDDNMEFENITGYISRNVKISNVLKMLQLSGIVNYEISGSKIIIKGS